MSSRLVRQVIAAMLQRRPFVPTLRPSPLFPGWTSASVSDVLASIPRYFFLTPRSIGRQPITSRRYRSPLNPRPLPHHHHPFHLGVSSALDFFTWVETHCGFLHDDLTLREMSRLLSRGHNSFPTLWRFLRLHHRLATTATVTAVIQTLGEHGFAADALAAFHRMRQLHCKPDVISYNSTIAALARVANFKKARLLLDQMEIPGARCPPDTFTYTILINAYCKHAMRTGCRKATRRRMWEANHMFRRMIFNGVPPDVVTYNSLIDGLCKTYRLGRALELFDDMSLRGCSPNWVTYNSFIRYYSAVNEADRAVEMMRDMESRGHGVPGSSSYTPIIHAMCESRRMKEARELVSEMVSFGSIPREFTYKVVCDALKDSGEEGFPESLCRRIERGVDERFRQVMRVKPALVERSVSALGECPKF